MCDPHLHFYSVATEQKQRHLIQVSVKERRVYGSKGLDLSPKKNVSRVLSIATDLLTANSCNVHIASKVFESQTSGFGKVGVAH